MGFKEVTSLDADVTVSIGKRDKKTGKLGPKSAEGYYLGNRVVKGKNNSPSTLHFLQTENGNLGIWGTRDMNQKLSQITVGSMVRITSTGTKPTKNGDMYLYKVEEDQTNSIEVSLATTTDTGYADESDDDSGGNGYTLSGDDIDENGNYSVIAGSKSGSSGTVTVNSLEAAAARKARVDALLGKKAK